MLIISNWKAYIETREEGKKLLSIAKRVVGKSRKLQIVLAPPAPLLSSLAAGKRSRLSFAGQDVSTTSIGAATGEISAAVLRDAGASYVIVGHSERRAKGETDELIAEKIRRAVTAGLIPILCIGERERDVDGRYLTFLRNQISTVLSELSPKERTSLIFAYEPVWAIGKRAEDAMSPEDVREMVLYVRKILGEFFPGKGAQKALILYGGSVEPLNVLALAKNAGINGFLVGHASAEPMLYAALLKALA